jgi:cytochrome c oxidase subunit 2
VELPPAPTATRRPPRPARAAARKWAVAGAVLAGLVLSGCQVPTFGAYKGVTAQGRDAFKLWQGFFIAGAAIFVLVFLLILWSVLRYRRRSEEIPHQFQYSTAFEILYTVIPVLIVVALFVFTVITENEVDSVGKNPAVTVNVEAFQWGWQFTYPKYGVRVLGAELQDPEMVLPAGETVHVVLTSADVIHGFYVPQFNFSRYAQPGVTNNFDLDVQHAGTYRGQCTQLCGLYHSLMIFRVKAVPPAQFTSWIHTEQHTTNQPDSIAAAKRQIAQQGGLR